MIFRDQLMCNSQSIRESLARDWPNGSSLQIHVYAQFSQVVSQILVLDV